MVSKYLKLMTQRQKHCDWCEEVLSHTLNDLVIIIGFSQFQTKIPIIVLDLGDLGHPAQKLIRFALREKVKVTEKPKPMT